MPQNCALQQGKVVHYVSPWWNNEQEILIEMLNIRNMAATLLGFKSWIFRNDATKDMAINCLLSPTHTLCYKITLVAGGGASWCSIFHMQRPQAWFLALHGIKLSGTHLQSHHSRDGGKRGRSPPSSSAIHQVQEQRSTWDTQDGITTITMVIWKAA